jgi:hypothetical protein
MSTMSGDQKTEVQPSDNLHIDRQMLDIMQLYAASNNKVGPVSEPLDLKNTMPLISKLFPVGDEVRKNLEWLDNGKPVIAAKNLMAGEFVIFTECTKHGVNYFTNFNRRFTRKYELVLGYAASDDFKPSQGLRNKRASLARVIRYLDKSSVFIVEHRSRYDEYRAKSEAEILVAICNTNPTLQAQHKQIVDLTSNLKDHIDNVEQTAAKFKELRRSLEDQIFDLEIEEALQLMDPELTSGPAAVYPLTIEMCTKIRSDKNHFMLEANGEPSSLFIVYKSIIGRAY